MNKIGVCLWFDSQAEAAAKFYTSIFKDGKILSTTYYSADTPSNKPKGSVLTVNLELNGVNFTLLNGGPFFKLSEAASIVVYCDDQEEIDYYWERLSAVPESEQCGWLKDKYGVSWKIVPKNIDRLVANEPTMKVFLEMKKIDIAELEKAA